MKNFFLLFYFLLIVFAGYSQDVTYSGYSPKEIRSGLRFEILGKVGKHYLVYKLNNFKDFLQVMDENMNIVSYKNIDFLPAEVIRKTFIAYPSHILLTYNYTKGEQVYTEAVKINELGNLTGDKVLLDSGQNTNIIYSENKQRILLYHFSNTDDGRSIVVTKLFDAGLNLLEKNTSLVRLNMRQEAYNNFLLTNEGAFSFTISKITGPNELPVNTIDIVLRKPNTVQYVRVPLSSERYFIETPSMDVDNFNNSYIINSFFVPEANSNYKLGLFSAIMNGNNYSINKKFNYFANKMLEKNDTSNPALLFKNFVLQKIVLKKDGSFIVIAENLIENKKPNLPVSSRRPPSGMYFSNTYPNIPDNQLFNTQIDRLGILHPVTGILDDGTYRAKPQVRKYKEQSGILADSYPYYGQANELLVLDISNSLELKNNAFISKKQKKGSFNYVSYGMVNHGPKLELFYIDDLNDKDIVNSRTYTAGGLLKNNATLRTMEKGHKFMPRYIKQVAANEFIIPTFYKERAAFAKLVY